MLETDAAINPPDTPTSRPQMHAPAGEGKFNLDTTQIAEHPTTIASHGIELLNATFMRKNGTNFEGNQVNPGGWKKGIQVNVDWWLAEDGHFDLDAEKLSFDITPRPNQSPPVDYVRFDPHGWLATIGCNAANFDLERAGDHEPERRCHGQVLLRIPPGRP